MNILLVMDGFDPGGAQRVVIDLARMAIKDPDVNVFIAVSKAHGVLSGSVPEGVTVFEFGRYRELLDAVSFTKKMVDFCELYSIDIIVSHMMPINKAIARAKILDNRLPPVIGVEHTEVGRQFARPRLRRRRFLRLRWKWFTRRIETKFLYKKLDKIVIVAGTLADGLLNHFSVEPSKIVMIHNPVDINRAVSPGTVWEHFSSSIGKTVISIGRFDQVKNFHLLIEAFSQVSKMRGSNCDKLLLIGDGPRRQQLANYAHDLGVSDQVVFCGFQEDVFSYLKESDVFVSTSHFEGLGNAMLEAIAFGCPCIATRTAGSEEIAKYVDGIAIVEQGDLEGLSKKIYEQLENPIICISSRDREFVNGLSPDKVWRQYKAVISQALGICI